MKVRELIQELGKFSDDTEIYFTVVKCNGF